MEQGTLVLVNYTAKVKETGEILEVTKEEDAKALSVYDASKRYEPKLVAVGEQWVLKGLDEALLKSNPGDKLTVEVPPEKGFGLRDPNKVRLIPIKRFGEDASKLKIGEQVQVDNRIGTVRYIGSGRVQVDFNHRLAGKSIVYDVEVLRTLTDPKEITLALIKRRLPVDETKVQLELQGDTASITLPQEILFMDGVQYAKKAISDEVFKYAKGITRVIFTEVFESPERAKQKEEEKVTEEAKKPKTKARKTSKKSNKEEQEQKSNP